MDIHEHDVPYHVRFEIDCDVRCGHWFTVRAKVQRAGRAGGAVADGSRLATGWLGVRPGTAGACYVWVILRAWLLRFCRQGHCGSVLRRGAQQGGRGMRL